MYLYARTVMNEDVDLNCPIDLPQPPEKPLESDCCGNGCTPCVFDIYQEELELWKTECYRIKCGKSVDHQETSAIESQDCLPLERDIYNGFTIVSIQVESHDTIRVRFSLPSHKSLGLTVGQHIILRTLSSSGSWITRQYTPISPLECTGYFEIIFKIYPNGRMSSCMKLWKVGDDIEMRGPMAGLSYSPNKYVRVLMLSAGTGIAPMSQVIDTILQNELEETVIRMLYACKTYGDILARNELSEWKRYWNFSVIFVLSREPGDSTSSYQYDDEIIKGHIDEGLLRKELGDSWNNTLVLVCGTRLFDTDMLAYLSKLGLPESNVHKF